MGRLQDFIDKQKIKDVEDVSPGLVSALPAGELAPAFRDKDVPIPPGSREVFERSRSGGGGSRSSAAAEAAAIETARQLEAEKSNRQIELDQLKAAREARIERIQTEQFAKLSEKQKQTLEKRIIANTERSIERIESGKAISFKSDFFKEAITKANVSEVKQSLKLFKEERANVSEVKQSLKLFKEERAAPRLVVPRKDIETKTLLPGVIKEDTFGFTTGSGKLFGTRQDLTSKVTFDVPVLPFGGIVTREVGTQKLPSGDKISIMETKVIEPPKSGQGIFTERLATLGEVQQIASGGKAVTELKFTRAGQIFSKGKELLSEAESDASRKTVKPLFESLKIKEIIPEGLTVLSGQLSPVAKQIFKVEPLREFAKGGLTGILEDIEQQPIKQVITFGAGSAFGFGVKAIGSGTKLAGGLVGGFTRIGATRGATIAETGFTLASTTAGLGLTGLFGADVVRRAIAPGLTSAERGGIVGVSTKDLLLFGTGAFKGERAFVKTSSFIKTFGKTEIPFKSIADVKVLEGKGSFPVIKKGETPKQLRKRFLEAKLPGEEAGIPRAFKATDLPEIAKAKESNIGKILKITSDRAKRDILTGESLKGKTTIKSEFPGEFGADVVSPAFLRVGAEGKKPKLFGLDITGGQPTLVRVTLKKIKIPKQKGRAKILELQEALGGRRGLTPEKILATEPKLKSGEAITPFIKPEREIIFPFTTKFEDIKFKFFTEIDGIKVPIYQKTAIAGLTATPKIEIIPQTKLKSTLSRASQSLKEVSSDTGVRRPSIITPSRVGVTSVISSRSTPSTPSIISRTSRVSEISKVSKVSRPSSISKISRTSRVSEISKVSRPSSISKISRVISSKGLSSTATKSVLKSLSQSKVASDISKPPSISTPTRPTETLGRLIKFDTPSQLKSGRLFTVSIRRGGKFRTIATTRDLKRAFAIGTQRVGSTLAATFKVEGGTLQTPKGFRKKKGKEGTLFIERRGLRLSKLGEVKEIQRAKGRII